MTEIILFGLASSRRISEVCRMMHGDIEWDHVDKAGRPAPMYTVRDLKHPTRKAGNNVRFPMLDPLPEIIRRQPRMNSNDPTERVFPFNAKSVGQCYTRAKHELGIENLRLHDNRREAITRWLRILPPHKVKTISGHKTIALIESTYDAQNPEELHGEVREIREAA